MIPTDPAKIQNWCELLSRMGKEGAGQVTNYDDANTSFAMWTINTHSLMFKVMNRHMGEYYIHVLALPVCEYHFDAHRSYIYSEKICSCLVV